MEVNAEGKTMETMTKQNELNMSVFNGARLSYEKQDEWQKQANGYTIKLSYGRKTYSVDYWQGVGIKERPTLKGVMECLFLDAESSSENFEDFCSNFGYDTDSRKAERIYNACKRIKENLKRLLGEQYGYYQEKFQD